MRLVAIGNPGSPRTAHLAAAARRFDGIELVHVPWIDLLTERIKLSSVVRKGDVVRIDSPGRDFEVERALLRLGVDDHRPSEASVPVARIDGLSEDRGRIRWPRQWFFGFSRSLNEIGRELADIPHWKMSRPRKIQTMFDKPTAHLLLSKAGVPVAPSTGPVRSYDDLLGWMRMRNWQSAFVKLQTGSSGSGIIAIRFHGRDVAAYTTVEIDGTDEDGFPKLYNTRRIRRLSSHIDVAAVVNALAPHGLHVERWLPKATFDGMGFDLRVVVIDGKACHVVPRLSKSPMTNLHLLNRRGDPDAIRKHIGEAAWTAILTVAEAALKAFSNTLYAGVDVLIGPRLVKPVVLEVNAFGDLLPGILWNGMDTYTAELSAAFGIPPARPA
jgi:hypothetical protein